MKMEKIEDNLGDSLFRLGEKKEKGERKVKESEMTEN